MKTLDSKRFLRVTVSASGWSEQRYLIRRVALWCRVEEISTMAFSQTLEAPWEASWLLPDEIDSPARRLLAWVAEAYPDLETA